jgi:purine nucleoside permease
MFHAPAVRLNSRIRRLLGAGLGLALSLGMHAAQAHAPRPVKALVISMFGPEGQGWVDQYKLTDDVSVPGLSPDYPKVHCNRSGLCQITTGMGHANVAASITALVHSGQFDLRHTYFLIAGIAGIDPSKGTLGTAAWARYLVDYGIAWELDGRDAPSTWPSGYLGINTKGPSEKPPLDYRTEVFQLNEALLQKALALSSRATLEDSDTARTYRANWPIAPANQPPQVTQCDTAAGDTWWHGAILEKRAQDWTKLLTDGQGTYCTTQQEDNATYEALKRGAAAGLLDLNRVAVLRTASNFDRPYPGQTAYDSLVTSISGGFLPAIHNLVKAGGPLIDDILANWPAWKKGLPLATTATTTATTAPSPSPHRWFKLPVKVLVVSMFGPEAQPWIDAYQLRYDIRVPGLSPDYPAVHCNLKGLCNVTTGMGHANAAATLTALAHSGAFDLRQTYVLIAGIAGIDPAQGTIGTAAWARWAVDYGIAWEIDPREAPAGWANGYFGINTKGPNEKPPLDYRTEVFLLNQALVDKAWQLSAHATLVDSAEAQAFRARFPSAPANQPPKVTRCDTMAGDTWYAGTRLSDRARSWTKLLTDGDGTYCTTQQEDNATLEAIRRADTAGLMSYNRVAILRTGSDFDRPYPGQLDVDGLLRYQEQGGFVPATQNLVKAGGPLVDDILKNWKVWRSGVPSH